MSYDFVGRAIFQSLSSRHVDFENVGADAATVNLPFLFRENFKVTETGLDGVNIEARRPSVDVPVRSIEAKGYRVDDLFGADVTINKTRYSIDAIHRTEFGLVKYLLIEVGDE